MNYTTTPTQNCYECGTQMTLNTFPSKYAGIYECANCGASDTCEHENYTVDRDLLIGICDNCEVDFPIDVDASDYDEGDR